MNRRSFIATGGAAAALAIGGASGAFLLSGSKHQKPLTIDNTLLELQQLAKLNPGMSGAWTLAKVFAHCAQSVEYSMTGFPEHKSDFFKQTLGAAAFSAFDNVGQMTHNLTEAIPGAPEIANNLELPSSLHRLTLALQNFESFNGQLQPHFAFGALNKTEYARAHIMHINNHLQEVIVV